MSKKAEKKKEFDIVEAMADAAVLIELLKISRDFKKPLNLIVPGKGEWSIDFQAAKIEKKKSDKPEVTFEISENSIKALAEGSLQPVQAFMKGEIKIKGNMAPLIKLQTIQPKLDKIRAKY